MRLLADNQIAYAYLSRIRPLIFSQLQDTIIAFLQAGEISAHVGSQIAGSAGALQFSNAPPTLPRVSNITR
jgi:hypothetical protein